MASNRQLNGILQSSANRQPAPGTPIDNRQSVDRQSPIDNPSIGNRQSAICNV